MILCVFISCFFAAQGFVAHPEHHSPQPYSFGYTIKDKESVQHREEVGNGAGAVKGNYGFIDSKGIGREVDYVADHGGFRAQVKTNEPGASGHSPAAVHMISHPLTQAYVALPMHQAHNLEHHPLPAHDRHKFMTPLHEHEQRVPLHLPLHHNHVPVHMPVHEHVLPHHISLHAPVHGHVLPLHEHQLQIPHHEHLVPAHHGLMAPLHGHSHAYGLPHLYGPRYMGGLVHSHLLDAGYRGHGRIMNHANLIGGVIKGYDSRSIH